MTECQIALYFYRGGIYAWIYNIEKQSNTLAWQVCIWNSHFETYFRASLRRPTSIKNINEATLLVDYLSNKKSKITLAKFEDWFKN
jgi:hypothetical protein